MVSKNIRLEELLKQSNFSKKEIAEKLGINPRTLTRWERGKNSIPSDKVRLLADELGVNVGYLLGYSEISKQYDDEQFYKLPTDEIFPYSEKQKEDEKELRQYKSFVRFLIDNGIFLTNDEIDTNFKMMKLLDANNLFNGEKYLVRDADGDRWTEYKNGKYSNILNPHSKFAKSDIEKEIEAYIYEETHEELKYSTIKALKLLDVLKKEYGERNYLD
ncbi:helix-turn-helix domain-containing protein [Streptococcus pluranimalium]